jgi:methylated-DNA-protein-cysteine methyltransferase-like protein
MMRRSADISRAERELGEFVVVLQPGYVTTHGDLARRLGVPVGLVSRVLATMAIADSDGNSDTESEPSPWWRVVADGGAIGRGPHRDRQMARLRADGVPLSAAGIVQEFAERRVSDLSAMPKTPFARVEPDAAVRRSRGMKSHPE